MDDAAFDDAFVEALGSEDPKEQMFRLAERMKREGIGQKQIYLFLVEKSKPMSRDDPNYDHLLEAMDFVHGGPWAKGFELFPGSNLGVTGCAD